MNKNFDYLKQQPLFTTLYNQCDKAEMFCKSDPDKSAMACRRALEWTVDLIYKVQHWEVSPRASLFEKVQDQKFVEYINSRDLMQKLHFVRSVGNRAAHVGNVSRRDSEYAVLDIYYFVGDVLMLLAAYRQANRNPLGSAAGYGSSFPLNRQLTTDLLGFESMAYNVVYAQMGRGKTERNLAFALASVAGTLSKLAFDACLFCSQNFGFVKLPKECTTGSSIMPHKKNPDVFELIRGKSNKLQALPQQVTLIMNNLPTGYFRDLQIIKEVFLPAFDELKDCLNMAHYIVKRMEVNRHILDNPIYEPMFSVEEVNSRAAAGVPFRDAYRQVGMEIEQGKFHANKDIHHTHEGSIGNLCNDKIAALMNERIADFHFGRAEEAERTLLKR